jgi:hypothetical protein
MVAVAVFVGGSRGRGGGGRSASNAGGEVGVSDGEDMDGNPLCYLFNLAQLFLLFENGPCERLWADIWGPPFATHRQNTALDDEPVT